MNVAGGRLVEALVEAYEPYVRRRLVEHGLPQPEGLAEALRRGREWLRAELTSLLELPYPRQPRGPLEVFQAAMWFPTQVLAAAGAAEVPRDEVARNALPGDRYDLAPASSRDVGEEVWRLHMAWGVEKARELRTQT